MADRILLTGGSGLLGTALRALDRDLIAPRRSAFDVTRLDQVQAEVDQYAPAMLIHAAALVGTRACDDTPDACLSVNVGGTLNVARACAARGVRLVYISTDYVFDGRHGGYREDDPVAPVNLYGRSKAAGEQVALTIPDSLVIRTSFFSRARWKYPAAFVDQYSSALPVDEVAEQVLEATRSGVSGILHIGGPRRTLFELARSVDSTVCPARMESAGVALPRDVSLNSTRWRDNGNWRADRAAVGRTTVN